MGYRMITYRALRSDGPCWQEGSSQALGATKQRARRCYKIGLDFQIFSGHGYFVLKFAKRVCFVVLILHFGGGRGSGTCSTFIAKRHCLAWPPIGGKVALRSLPP
jgi:hypothetical protein